MTRSNCFYCLLHTACNFSGTVGKKSARVLEEFACSRCRPTEVCGLSASHLGVPHSAVQSNDAQDGNVMCDVAAGMDL